MQNHISHANDSLRLATDLLAESRSSILSCPGCGRLDEQVNTHSSSYISERARTYFQLADLPRRGPETAVDCVGWSKWLQPDGVSEQKSVNQSNIARYHEGRTLIVQGGHLLRRWLVVLLLGTRIPVLSWDILLLAVLSSFRPPRFLQLVRQPTLTGPPCDRGRLCSRDLQRYTV